jgi:signal transduction histidine kinase
MTEQSMGQSMGGWRHGFRIHPLPIRFLMYTEWLMLASCGSLAIFEMLSQGEFPLQHILILLLLGVMGLVIPDGKFLEKVVYTAIELGLVFYGTLLGYLHILPTLYLIVVIRSCFVFEARGRWFVAVLSFLLYLITQIRYILAVLPQLEHQLKHNFWMHQFSEVLMFAVGLFFVIKFINTWLSERQTRQQLSLAHDQLQQYALQIEDLAAVQERNRIARDIHDSLGHALTALNVQLQTVVKLWSVNSNEAKRFLEQAQKLGDTAIKEVRRSVHSLRADTKTDTDLERVILPLVADFQKGTGIEVLRQIQPGVILPAQIAKTLYRVVQEALTNTCKYAQASQVQIKMHTQAGQLHLSIIDNGQGFDPTCAQSGFGLQGIQERVAALQGQVRFQSQPGEGCQIVIDLPLTDRALDVPQKIERPVWAQSTNEAGYVAKISPI